MAPSLTPSFQEALATRSFIEDVVRDLLIREYLATPRRATIDFGLTSFNWPALGQAATFAVGHGLARVPQAAFAISSLSSFLNVGASAPTVDDFQATLRTIDGSSIAAGSPVGVYWLVIG